MPARPWRGEFLQFPPRWHTVLLPAPPGTATAIGMSLYTAVRPFPLLAQQVLWAGARVTAGRTVRGQRRRWSTSVDDGVLDGLWRELQRIAGSHGDGMAIYRRLQADRPALTFVFCAGQRSLLVRVRDHPPDLQFERALSTAAPTAFRVPRLLGAGVIDGWHWSAQRMFAIRPHRPVRHPSMTLFAEITALVEAALPRPGSTPSHWQGCHGDLTPWNLRRAGGVDWLIDWEDAGYAPPGADQVYFQAVRAAVGGRRLRAVADDHPEARAYWLDMLGRRRAAPVEDRLARRLRAALGA